MEDEGYPRQLTSRNWTMLGWTRVLWLSTSLSTLTSICGQQRTGAPQTAALVVNEILHALVPIPSKADCLQAWVAYHPLIALVPE